MSESVLRLEGRPGAGAPLRRAWYGIPRLTAHSDAELVRDALDGRARAFDELVKRYAPAAYAIALAHLESPDEAEDACQDAFVRAWENLAACRDATRFGAWLARIVRNTSLNRVDYLRVRRADPLDQVLVPAARRSDNPETRLASLEERQRLDVALARLAPREREVLLLYDFEGYQHREIATLLRISEFMSRRHLSRARRLMRKYLSGHDAT